MEPFLVAAALAHAREAMRPNMGVRTKGFHNSFLPEPACTNVTAPLRRLGESTARQ
jgi:hypothetical protein